MLGGTIGLLGLNLVTTAELFPSFAVIGVLLVGATIGAGANLLLFTSLSEAPNPGVPIAIANAASLLVFLISAGLAVVVPRYFPPVKLDLFHFIGITLTLAGVTMLVIKR